MRREEGRKREEGGMEGKMEGWRKGGRDLDGGKIR